MIARQNQVNDSESGASWWTQVIAMAVLALLAVAPYTRTFGNGFVNYDDPQYVTANRHVQEGLTLGLARWAFSTGTAGNWHPLTWLSHALDCQLYGLLPAGHHLTNIVLHVGNTLALYLLLTRLTGQRRRAVLVAALFAVHPLHVESVAWAAERKDVLSTFLGLVAMGIYAGYARKRGPARLACVAVALALSLMAKPMFVTLPVLLLVLDYWPLRRLGSEPVTRLVAEKVPLFALSLASGLVAIAAQRAGHAWRTAAELPVLWRIENALVSCVTYLAKALWPAGLAVYYPHPEGTLPCFQILGAGLILAGISVAAWRLRSPAPYLLAGWLCYLISLTPVIGVLQVGGQAMADRYTYFPLIGVFLAVVWGCGDIVERYAVLRWPLALAAACAVVALSAVTWRQVGVWRNSETLFRHALAVTERNPIAHSNLASALLEQERYGEAEQHCRAALAIKPDYADAYINLGISLGGLGRLPEALDSLQRAVTLAPARADAHFNLGVAELKTGQAAAGAAELRKALEINPEDIQTRRLLQQIEGTPPFHQAN